MVATERASVFDRNQIGIETVPGTAVAANRRLRSIGFTSQANAEFEEIIAQGSKIPSVVYPTVEWNALSMAGALTYTEVVYALSMIFGPAAISTPGGATLARDWLWTPGAADPWEPVTITLEQGSRVRAQRSAFALLVALTLNFASRAVGIEGSGIGRAIQDGVQMSTNEVTQIAITGGPTGGTFTITYDGATTAGIAYNAAASVVQAALEALANINVGDVNVTGGALPGTPVLIEWRGRLGQRNITPPTANAAGLTGGTTPAVNVTTTTPGVAPTLVPIVPVLPKQLDLYIDDTFGTLGTTKYTRAFAAALAIGGAFGGVFPMDSDNDGTYAAIADLAPDHTLAVTLAANAQGEQFTEMRSGLTRYARISASAAANAIETGFTYEMDVDYAGVINAVGGDDDADGTRVRQWTFRAIEDADLTPLRIRVRNAIAAL